MKICIVGAGVVGSSLARKLSEDGYDIAIIDKDSSKIEELQSSIDAAAYVCDAFDEECIKHFVDYDFFIVVTNRDEINLSVSLMLKAVFKKEKILIRVDKDILSKQEIEDFLGVEIVNTFSEIYKNVENIIRYPFMFYTNELDHGKLILFGYKISGEDNLKNRAISDLKEIREKIPFTIALIERDGKFVIPSGKRVLLEGDAIYVLLEKEYLDKFIELAGIKYKPIESITFLGISNFGISLIKRLIERNIDIKVIEPNLEKCEKLAEEFPDLLVINGKYTDEELLKNENLSNSDLIISASYKEDGILACILAKKLGAKKVLALIEQPEYEEIAHSLDIDIPIVSRKLVARKVYRKIRHKGFLDILEIAKNINLYEKVVDKKLAEKKVEEISDKAFLILAIKRENRMYIASGKTVLKEGDILLVLEKEEDEEF